MTVLEQLNSNVDLQERLIRRAWDDEQFAELLRTNPRMAIASETGVELPGSVDIQVHQEDETTLHLVLPAQPDSLPAPPDVLPDIRLDPHTALCTESTGAYCWGHTAGQSCNC